MSLSFSNKSLSAGHFLGGKVHHTLTALKVGQDTTATQPCQPSVCIRFPCATLMSLVGLSSLRSAKSCHTLKSWLVLVPLPGTPFSTWGILQAQLKCCLFRKPSSNPSFGSKHIRVWITPYCRSSHMATGVTCWMVIDLFAHQIPPHAHTGGQGQCKWFTLTPSSHTADISVSFLED